ncbi:3,5-dihydroxyphenylacetyl-CoA synthase [subsurface metagenome]
MKKPKILSIGYSLPPHSYTQKELFGLLGYQSPGVRRIFENSGIERRYLWTIPFGKSWQELTQEYQKAAIELSKKAILDCLDGRPLDSFGCLIFTSCTGYSCPGISHHLARELDLPDNLIHSNLLGMGCEASSPALSRAVDYVIANDKPALLVSCEPCSCAYFPAPERDLENTVSNCLFGDAAAAILVGYDDNPHHPEIHDLQSYFNKDYLDYLGFKWVDGRLKCVLNKDVPRSSGILVKEAVGRILEKHQLSVEDIDHWAVHPGGTRVIEEIQKALGLDSKKLSLSYQVLREMGNVSSATVIIMGKQLNRVKPPAWGLGVTMGAGSECGCVLLRWR